MMNFNSNMGYPQQGGYYNGMIFNEGKPLQMTQGLSQEQMKSIRKNTGFSLDISQDELWRSFCTHRYENKFATTQNDEGEFTCAICGTKFHGFDGDVKDARELVNKVIDLMETTKMQSLTLPTHTIQEFFQFEPLLKRLPALYEQALTDYNRATGLNNDGYYYGQENNAFAMYHNMINPMAGNNYYDPAMAGQPMYGSQVAYQQPMMNGYQQQQPMMNGYQQPMMGGYQQQPMMYQQQPMMNGYQQQPGINPISGQPMTNNQQPVQQPAAQPAAENVTVNKTLTD